MVASFSSFSDHATKSRVQEWPCATRRETDTTVSFGGWMHGAVFASRHPNWLHDLWLRVRDISLCVSFVGQWAKSNEAFHIVPWNSPCHRKKHLHNKQFAHSECIEPHGTVQKQKNHSKSSTVQTSMLTMRSTTSVALCMQSKCSNLALIFNGATLSQTFI